jgi:hypothetical protein
VRSTSSEAKIAAMTEAYTHVLTIDPDWSTTSTTSHSWRRRWFAQKWIRSGISRCRFGSQPLRLVRIVRCQSRFRSMGIGEWRSLRSAP